MHNHIPQVSNVTTLRMHIAYLCHTALHDEKVGVVDVQLHRLKQVCYSPATRNTDEMHERNTHVALAAYHNAT